MAPVEPSVSQYERLGERNHLFRLGSQHLTDLQVDLSNVDPADVGSLSLQLMGASALHCMAGTIAAFMSGRGATIRALRGRAIIDQETNSQRRMQASRLRVELEVDVDEKDAELLDKARRIIEERGCLVTYSLERGMQVEHVIRRAGEDPQP